MTTARFKFIGLAIAAERLGVTRHQLLQWVEEGRIRPVTGTGQQSVFRTSDVERLARELGLAASTPESTPPVSVAPAAPATEAEAHGQTPPAEERTVRPRTARRDPVRLVGARLSQDARWAEITDADISAWLDALEPVQYERVRRVANIAIERLQRLLDMMAGFDGGTPARG